jgi:hypothetical protein
MDHKGWYSRGCLPHFDSRDVIQFVTFRLADSLPKEAVLRLPNHVHVLLTVLPGKPLGTIVSSWKRFTAREANREIGRAGAFWQDDYWDRFIRNDEHFAATESYIDLNPVKAGLVAEAHLWPWGSARFR